MPIAATVVLLAGCGGPAYHSTLGARLDHRGRTIVVVPRRHGRWTLVLLHGRSAGPQQFLSQPFFDELAVLGRHAPVVVLVYGGNHSYWHDRKDGRWGTMVLRRLHGRVAVGGISMGGFGALLLGARAHVCAVGAHSPALWRRAADTAPGAFDDAADFARNDLVGHPPRYHSPVWIDAQLHVWPGGHEESYWRAHMRSYLRFYARSCG